VRYPWSGRWPLQPPRAFPIQRDAGVEDLIKRVDSLSAQSGEKLEGLLLDNCVFGCGWILDLPTVRGEPNLAFCVGTRRFFVVKWSSSTGRGEASRSTVNCSLEM
jgi:hypothetical protein